ncbi:MAG: ribonuclease HII [Candidatus Bipolaricaulota bacterium]|nr:ribonuclease HII [Candidatus Bipolaricaulota bacterium]
MAFDRALAAPSPPLPLDCFASPRLVGFDEAGRGAWAGPVAVGCVHLPVSLSDDDLVSLLAGVDDSKRLSPATRERLFARIAECARFAVGFASAAEIDRVGIVAACRLAAARAYRRLAIDADLVLLDRGLSLEAPGAPRAAEFTHGDARSLHIAAASIVAKVSRDARMVRLDRTWPDYGLARHKGYGTKAHRDALLARGISPLHRRTYLHGLREADL